MKIDIEWVRKIRTGREEKGEIMVVKLRTEEDKNKIMDRKRRLKGTQIWIKKDKIKKTRRTVE